MACHRLVSPTRIALAVGCALLCVAAVACSGGEESGTGTSATESVPTGTSATESVPEEGSREVTLPGSGDTASLSTGEMSKDFPDDIPSPPDSEPQSSVFFPGRGGIAAFLSSASRDDLRDFYTEGLASEGWDVGAPSEEEVRTVIPASKGSRTTSIVISSGPKGSEVVISVEGG